MALTKEDKEWLRRQFVASENRMKTYIHDEINRLYMDVIRKVAKYHPEEAETLHDLVETQRRRD